MGSKRSYTHYQQSLIDRETMPEQNQEEIAQKIGEDSGRPR